MTLFSINQQYINPPSHLSIIRTTPRQDNIRNIAKLLLDLTDSLEISSAVEGITTEEEKFDEVTSHITSSNIKTAGKMGKRETIKHGDNVGDTITTVHDNTSQETFWSA